MKRKRAKQKRTPRLSAVDKALLRMTFERDFEAVKNNLVLLPNLNRDFDHDFSVPVRLSQRPTKRTP